MIRIVCHNMSTCQWSGNTACRICNPRVRGTRGIVAGMVLALSLFVAGVANAADAPKKPDMVKVATCKDGKTYYHATGERRGACSGHGGVATWADGTAPKGNGKRSETR